MSGYEPKSTFHFLKQMSFVDFLVILGLGLKLYGYLLTFKKTLLMNCYIFII